MTQHFDEVKAVARLTGSYRNIAQVGQYGRMISEVQAASGGLRALGRGLGVLGIGYDIVNTGVSIGTDLSRKDSVGAGREHVNRYPVVHTWSYKLAQAA